MNVDFMFLGCPIYKGVLMSVQFKHIRNFWSISNGGSTIAVELSEDSLKEVQVTDKVMIKLGIAKCSEDDCFNKKVGRDLASSRMKEVPLEVTSISKYKAEGSRIITRVVVEKDGVYLVFTRSSDSRNFRLGSASLTD